MKLQPIDTNSGPALPLAPAELDALVARAVDRVFPLATPAERPPSASRPRSFSPARRAWTSLGLAACVTIAGSTYVATSGEPAKNTKTMRTEAKTTDPPAPLAADASILAIPRGTSIDVRDLPSARTTQEPRPATVGTRDLLREANELRAERRWDDAAKLYERVASSGGPEAVTAMLALAALRLEHQGDPRDARQLYETILAREPAGVLAEEARWGIAMASGSLGDTPAEIAALEAFLEHHPSSLTATKARRRLAELRGTR